MQNGREVGSRREEVGREVQCAAKQRLGIAIAFDPRRQLGEHADRGHVERIALQMRFQYGLGVVQSSLEQGECGRHQFGVPKSPLDRRLGRVEPHPQLFFRALAIA